MVELDVDMGCLGDDDLMHVVLRDERGEHESVGYVRRDEYDEMREATARRKDTCLRLQDENARLREQIESLQPRDSEGTSVDRVTVNGHELTAFDLPPKPSEECEVSVDGLGEVTVRKGKPPIMRDVPGEYMRKMVPALCEQNAGLRELLDSARMSRLLTESENEKLLELVDELWALAYGYAPTESELDAAREMMRELGIEVDDA